MAVNLNTTSETGQNIKKQIENERNMAFKIVRIAAVVLTAVLAVSTALGVYNDYTFVETTSIQVEQAQARYQALQDEAAAWHAENDKKINDLDEETGTVVSEIVLPSARAAGEEVASLQNKFYKDGYLLTADKNRFSELVKGSYGNTATVWGGIGAQLDPDVTDLEWEFDTWYDASPDSSNNVPTKYDCVWTCWHRTENSEYLVMALFAVYDSDTGMFTANNMYYSDFAYMLQKNGAVEASGGSGGSPIDQGTVDELTDFLNNYDEDGTDGQDTSGDGQDAGADPAETPGQEPAAGGTEPEQDPADGNYGSNPDNA